MIKLFVRTFIKNWQDVGNPGVRERYCVLSYILGMICNAVLFAVKMTVGLLTGSIAITSDAFNNLSDIGTSAVSLVSVKLSNKHPDEDHPFGHGRLEYISSLIVAFVIVIVGFEFFTESIDKIIHPAAPEFNAVLLVILALCIGVKVWMYSYNRYLGKKINSPMLSATAKDSLSDCISTLAVVASAIAGHFIPGIPFDGIFGLIVSGIIMYSGFGIAKDVITVLLGTAPSEELIKSVTDIISDNDFVVGVHDMIVHDYGPGRIIASAHAEIPASCNIVEAHEIIDRAEERANEELGIILVIHMDPVDCESEFVNTIRENVKKIVEDYNEKYGIHDLRITNGESRINVIFDMTVPFATSPEEKKKAQADIAKKIREYDIRLNAVIKVEGAY